MLAPYGQTPSVDSAAAASDDAEGEPFHECFPAARRSQAACPAQRTTKPAPQLERPCALKTRAQCRQPTNAPLADFRGGRKVPIDAWSARWERRRDSRRGQARLSWKVGVLEVKVSAHELEKSLTRLASLVMFLDLIPQFLEYRLA